jgi:hypothetical protein
VAPLRLGGLRGKQSTPSVGWEVPVRSRRSASGSGTERADDTRSRRKATVFLFTGRLTSRDVESEKP